MNKMSTTCEYSGTSGCESGWTMYLDQSLNSGDGKCYKGGYDDGKWSYHDDDDDDDDDLSMVSDASSGPSRQKNIHNEYEEEGKCGFYHGSNSQEKRKTRLKKDVDDTASSTVFTKTKPGLLKKVSSSTEKYVLEKSGTEKKKGGNFGAQENWDRLWINTKKA